MPDSRYHPSTATRAGKAAVAPGSLEALADRRRPDHAHGTGCAGAALRRYAGDTGSLAVSFTAIQARRADPSVSGAGA
ncbi:MAG: hypothetical protein ACYC2Z_05055 [Candidatus Nanopelagicales bacterium]